MQYCSLLSVWILNLDRLHSVKVYNSQNERMSHYFETIKLLTITSIIRLILILPFAKVCLQPVNLQKKWWFQ